jgi:intracellular septation protein A
MQSRAVLQAAVFALFVAALVWLVVSNADDWSDWVVFGVIVLTTIGAARAVYARRYPAKRRTFIRHSEPPPRE